MERIRRLLTTAYACRLGVRSGGGRTPVLMESRMSHRRAPEPAPPAPARPSVIDGIGQGPEPGSVALRAALEARLLQQALRDLYWLAHHGHLRPAARRLAVLRSYHENQETPA